MWSGAERGNPFFPRAQKRTVCIAHKSSAAASSSSMVARSVRSRSCHDKWPFTAPSPSRRPPSLFSPPFFPLLRPSLFSPFGLREMKPYRVPVSASAKISAPISLSFLPRPPLHSLIWRRKWPLTAPGLSLLVPLFQVSTLPSASANLVLKFRRESNLPAFSSPLSLGESRPPLSAVTPYPPPISSVPARSLVVIRAY